MSVNKMPRDEICVNKMTSYKMSANKMPLEMLLRQNA